MRGRTIAIGDIHGCDKALESILEAICPAADDTIVTLGDYVDRGPSSRQVIDRLLALKDHCTLIPLLGNHEEMMNAVVFHEQEPYEWLRHGGVDTLDSYGFVGDLGVIGQPHREFLSQLQEFYENETHIFLHANYDPNSPLDQQPADLLRWVKLTENLPRPHFSGRRAIVGHTHNRQAEIVSFPHLVCIDTYCYGGGLLTALDTTNDVVWQADSAGVLKSSEPIPL